MNNKSISMFCLIFACALLLAGCAQPSLAVHEKLDGKSLSLIKSTDVFVFTTQKGLVAHITPDTIAMNTAISTGAQYAPPNGTGLIGLIIGSILVHHIDNSQQHDLLDKPLKEVKDAMQGYSVEKSFSEKLSANLHKLQWLNSHNANLVNATTDKMMLNSILDESNSPLVMTVVISYSLDQNLNTYWINAEVTLYPKSRALESLASHGSDENANYNGQQDSHPILYRNYFHYTQVLNAARNPQNAADTWSNSAGSDYIRNVTEIGLETLARLITYDLSLYPYHLKDKDAKTQVSGFDGSGSINGTLIAENSSMVSLRTRDGYIYCLPRSK